MQEQEIREESFTEGTLFGETNEQTGHFELFSIKGHHILTVLHPVQHLEKPISEEDLNRFKGDLRLHQHAGSLYDCLKEIRGNLQDLKDGSVSIFKFPIDELLKMSEVILKRASEIH